MKISFGRFALSVLSVFVLSAVLTLSAQDLDDVTIAGKLTDSNGLAIVGASVTATEIETGVERTVTTNDEGRFRIIELKPGVYKVRAASTGFGAQEKIDLQTVSGSTWPEGARHPYGREAAEA